MYFTGIDAYTIRYTLYKYADQGTSNVRLHWSDPCSESRDVKWGQSLRPKSTVKSLSSVYDLAPVN